MAITILHGAELLTVLSVFNYSDFVLEHDTFAVSHWYIYAYEAIKCTSHYFAISIRLNTKKAVIGYHYNVAPVCAGFHTWYQVNDSNIKPLSPGNMQNA